LPYYTYKGCCLILEITSERLIPAVSITVSTESTNGTL
jgi:hypothetical protein